MGQRMLAVAAVCAAVALPAQAADLAQMQALMEQLAARVEVLEKRNAELENALTTERLSEREPEIATRLKALEARTQAMDAPVKRMEALDGIKVEGSITGVAQSADAGATASGQRETRANYRGDVEVTLPGGEWGDITGTAFAHVRFGQGSGVGLRHTYTSTPNSVGFEVGGVVDPDSSFAVLAQGWYQLDIPLPRGRSTQAATQRARVTVGKIDMFGFFDGNAIADDETTRFQNNAFVHNPLLDSGGGIGADAYVFAPGATNRPPGPTPWGSLARARGPISLVPWASRWPSPRSKPRGASVSCPGRTGSMPGPTGRPRATWARHSASRAWACRSTSRSATS